MILDKYKTNFFLHLFDNAHMGKKSVQELFYFELSKKILSIALDNSSNNNVAIEYMYFS